MEQVLWKNANSLYTKHLRLSIFSPRQEAVPKTEVLEGP
jgi:hypothetical protein